MGRKKKSNPLFNKNKTNLNRQKANNEIEDRCKCVMIGLLSRVDKPVMNVIPYFHKENVIEYDFRPRRISVNGLCLLCMKLCKSEVLCDFCKMVSYCSEKHKKENYDEHKKLCSALTQCCSSDNGLQFAKDLEPDQYRILRIKLIALVEEKLNRSLDLWEREIILYPRNCRICHCAGTESCRECGVDFLCGSEEHCQEHKRWCASFKIFRRIVQIQREHGSAKPEVPDVISEFPCELPDHFDAVVANLIGGTNYYEEMDCFNYATLSYLSTIPLSTLYAFQKTSENDRVWKQKKNVTIHIIGAEFEFECANLRFWEKLFVHFLPSLKHLNLVFIGPELQAPQMLFDALKNVHLCSSCRFGKRAIRVAFHPGKLYHDITSCSDVTRPDLICLFNPGLYRRTGFSERDTWPQTIREFCKYEVPVAVTSYTEHEIPRDIARIESICPVEVLMKPQRNPFASLKPDRNFVSDHENPLIFKNYCIAIVRGKHETHQGIMKNA